MVLTNRGLLLLAGVTVVLGIILVQCTQLDSKTARLTQTESILAAATDSTRYYRDRYGREVAEKKALEADLATLNQNYKVLTHNQRALVQDVKHLPRNEQERLITASSVVQAVTIQGHQNVDSTAREAHLWTLCSDTLSYTIRANGDTLRIDSLVIPNRLVVTQHRDSKDVIHVTARNTNPMIRSTDVDSVVSPEKKPKKFWQWVFLGTGIILGTLATR